MAPSPHSPNVFSNVRFMVFSPGRLFGVSIPASTREAVRTAFLSNKVVPATIALSMILLVNIGLTGLLVDPRVRYDYSLLMFKIMISGVGGAVLISLFSQLLSMSPLSSQFGFWRNANQSGRKGQGLLGPAARGCVRGGRMHSDHRLLLSMGSFSSARCRAECGNDPRCRCDARGELWRY